MVAGKRLKSDPDELLMLGEHCTRTEKRAETAERELIKIKLLTHLEGDNHPLLRRSHRDAGLAVLLAPDVPAILLEMGFITNPEDERVLTDERARRRLMRSVAEGIDRYFREPSAPVMVAGEVAGGG